MEALLQDGFPLGFLFDRASRPVNLRALIVSPNLARLQSCSMELGRLDVQTDLALSTKAGGKIIKNKSYHLLILDTDGIDWHHLQLCAAARSLQYCRHMPVVVILGKEGEVVSHCWGDGNDFDEQLSFPLDRSAVEKIIMDCTYYFQSTA